MPTTKRQARPNADWNILAPYFAIPTGRRMKSQKARDFDQAMRSERGRATAALMKARNLAQLHGITIERESANAYWVTCPERFEEGPADPLDGEHFCADGLEVLAAVGIYVEAIKAKAAGAAS